MKKHEDDFTHIVKQPHKLKLDWEPLDPLYEKAFFSPDADTDDEYTHNTTAWD